MAAHRRTELRRPRRRARLHGLIAGVSVFLSLVGGGASYAAWTAGATASSTASGATLGISTAGFDSTAFTFQNHLLSTTGSVTLVNDTTTSSTTPGTFTMTLGYTGSAALAAKLAVSVWPTTNPSGCAAVGSPPSGTITGTWGSVVTTASPLTGGLAAGATKSYCIRVVGAERGELASPDGALSIQPSVSATLSVGNWSQSASATTTQKTAWLFPAFAPAPGTWYQVTNQGTGNCLDVYSASAASGTGAIDYACKTGNTTGDYNQEWKFTRSTGDYFDLTPRHAQALRLDVTGGSLATLAPVDLQTGSTSRPSQQWQPQKQPSGDLYQLVNRASGLCLQVNNTDFYLSEVEYAQAACDGSAGQRYTFTVKDVDAPAMTLQCADTGNGSNRTVSFSLSPSASQSYRLQVRTTATTWVDLMNGAYSTGSVTISGNPPFNLAAGTYPVRAVTSGDAVLGTSQLVVVLHSGGSYTYLRCSP